MDLDVASADWLIETVIVNSNFAAVLVPDLDAESVVIWVQILGPDHEATLASMHNLAIVLAEQQKSEEARTLLEQVLETMQRTLGPDDPDTCKMMSNLATFLKDQRKFDRARELYEQVIDIQRRILGPERP